MCFVSEYILTLFYRLVKWKIHYAAILSYNKIFDGVCIEFIVFWKNVQKNYWQAIKHMLIYSWTKRKEQGGHSDEQFITVRNFYERVIPMKTLELNKFVKVWLKCSVKASLKIMWYKRYRQKAVTLFCAISFLCHAMAGRKFCWWETVFFFKRFIKCRIFTETALITYCLAALAGGQ